NNKLNAKAFTVGKDVYFNQGEYQPHSPEGRQLLAHELTHVVEQSHSDTSNTLQRNPGNGPLDALINQNINDLIALGNKPIGKKSSYTEPGCPPTFCQPFVDKDEAAADLEKWRLFLLAGIGISINSKVLPYWDTYLQGGSQLQDLSAKFGNDFTASWITKDTTAYVLGEFQKDLEANHTAFLSGAPGEHKPSEELTPRTKVALETNVKLMMSFTDPNEIPGNLTGEVSHNQRSIRIGANPSPSDDSREADFRFTLIPFQDGSVSVIPSLWFIVEDTIDLCPGNCGMGKEQLATIPMSRFEATGLTGDVPILILFEAPKEKIKTHVIYPQPPWVREITFPRERSP